MEINPQSCFNFCANHAPLLRAPSERGGELSETEVMMKRMLGRESVCMRLAGTGESCQDKIKRQPKSTKGARSKVKISLQILFRRVSP